MPDVVYTIPAQRIVSTGGGGGSSVAPASIALTFPEGTTQFSYSFVLDSDDFVVDTAFDPAPTAEALDGAPLSVAAQDATVATLVRAFELDAGTSYVLSYELTPTTGSVAQTYLAALGGEPLPTFATFNDYVAFNNALVSANRITLVPSDGPFGPDAAIDLASIPGIGVSTVGDPVSADATEGPDVLRGTPGADAIDGLAGDDRIEGLAGDDVLTGGAGADTILGGAGADTMRGGSGDDLFFADTRRDVIEDSDGAFDEIRTTGDYFLSGSGIEALTATGGADAAIWGTRNNEVLTGNAGDNRLVGLGGTDVMAGGAGADDFVLFARGTTTELTIVDFDRAEGDRLGIDDQLIGLGEAGVDVRALDVRAALGLFGSGVATLSTNGTTARVDFDTTVDGTVDASLVFQGSVPAFADVLIF